MGWLHKLLIGEQDFSVEDYLKKYPQMDPNEAAVRVKLHQVLKDVREKEKRNDIPEQEWEGEA